MAKRRIRRPHERHRIDVVNQSSRNGASIQAIALHSTEGANIPDSIRDLEGLGGWFNNPEADASSHVGVDGDGYSARYVRDHKKAWTILQLNPVTLNIEAIGFAAQQKSKWTRAQRRKIAQYIAYWSKVHGIPVRRGRVGVKDGWPYISRTGVIKHSDLTKAGFGSHTDPGANFPFWRVLALAAYYRKRGW